MGTIVAVSVAFLILLWILFALRRRALRAYLLTTGIEVTGSAKLVSSRLRRAPSVVVSYVDSGGATRSVRKLITSAGDEQLVKKKVRVVFHPDRTSRDEYVLVAFGDSNRWFRVGFTHAN
ncbi:MAG: hypothetical protein Q8M65_08975 [Rhodoglobus sp.]|nr:hypothetical protein [Rhodoglobus sp.]